LAQPRIYLGGIIGITKMTAKLSLKEFVWAGIARKMLPSQKSSEQQIAKKIRNELSVKESDQLPSLSASEKDEFSLQLGKMIQSEAFWNVLSKDIGPPRPGESENAFVDRAKAAMGALIRSRMNV
jgi:hypothetical protein